MIHAQLTSFLLCRGIDFKGVRTVVNVHPPPDVRTYVHRVGRTGRAGQAGTAVSLLAPSDAGLANQIEQALSGEPHARSAADFCTVSMSH